MKQRDMASSKALVRPATALGSFKNSGLPRPRTNPTPGSKGSFPLATALTDRLGADSNPPDHQSPSPEDPATKVLRAGLGGPMAD